MQLTAHIHITCPHSKELLEDLEAAGVKSLCRIVETDKHPLESYRRGLLSVPALFADERLILAGNYDREWLAARLNSLETRIPDSESLFRSFINAAIDNVASASLLYLSENPAMLFDNPEHLLNAGELSRVLVEDNQVLLQALRSAVDERFPDFIRDKAGLFHKVLAMNFLRELYWLHREEISPADVKRDYNPNSLAHWLMIRPTLGRIGVPLDPKGIPEKGEILFEYLIEHFDELWPVARDTA